MYDDDDDDDDNSNDNTMHIFDVFLLLSLLVLLV